jgi:hypothetical protein
VKRAGLFAAAAGVGILLLAAAPSRAGDPAKLQDRSARAGLASIAMRGDPDVALSAQIVILSYSLETNAKWEALATVGLIAPSDLEKEGVRLRPAAGANREWSPHIVRSGAYHAAMTGIDRMRRINARGLPMTVCGQEFAIFSRVTTRRAAVVLTTAF